MTPQSPTAVATERLKGHIAVGPDAWSSMRSLTAEETLSVVSELLALRSPLQDREELVERLLSTDEERLNREPWSCEQDMKAAAGAIVELEARIAELEPQAKELKAIAFQVGEEDDPFAAWEAIQAFQDRAETAESALSTNEAGE